MKTNQDNIKNIVDKYFVEREIPIGLEERISNQIDNYAKKEQDLSKHPKFSQKLLIKVVSIAATLVIITTITIFLAQPQTEIREIADTCATAEEAYEQTQAAFTYLAAVFKETAQKVNETTKPISESRKTINKYIQ